MTRSIRFFLILGIGLLAIDGAIFLFWWGQDRAHIAPTVASSGTAAIGGPFRLSATDGKTVTDASFRGKWMLIYFGYTSCPDACPTALTNISIAIQTLRREAAAIQPLFITVDPKRDTRAVLMEYLKSFDPRIAGLTGSEEQIRAAAKAYRVYVRPEPAKGDNSYLIDHSSYVYLMDPGGVFVDVIDAATAGPEMAEKLQKLIHAHST